MSAYNVMSSQKAFNDYKQDIEEKKEYLFEGGVNFIPSDDWGGGEHGRFGLALPIDCFVDLALVNKICNSRYEFSYHCLDLFKNNYSWKNLSKIKHFDQTLGYTMDAFVLKHYFAECVKKFRHGFTNSSLLKWLPNYFCQCCEYSFKVAMDIENDNICSKCLLYAFSKGRKHYDHLKGCNFYHSYSSDLQIIPKIFKAYRLKLQLLLKIKKKCKSINNDGKNNQQPGPGGRVSDELTRLEFTKICFDLLESGNTDQRMHQIYANLNKSGYNKSEYKSGYTRNDNRFKGICKKWFAMKGFGFIEMDDDNKSGAGDLFVHQSEIRSGKGLYQGQNVEFSIVVQSDGRRKAINVEAGNHNNHQFNYKQNNRYNNRNRHYQ